MRAYSRFKVELLLILAGVLFNPFLLKAQNVYVYEYGENQNRYLIKISNSQVCRIQVGNFIDWYLDENIGVIGGNSSLILRQRKKELDTLLNIQKNGDISEVLDITGNGKKVIFTTYRDFNEYEQYYKSMMLYSLNIHCQTLSTIEFSDSLNVFSISLSPNGKKISFTHVSHHDIRKRFNTEEKTFLLVYDKERADFVVVDSAKYTDGEWFKATSVWIDDDSFFYYKKTVDKELGSIYKHSLNDNRTTAVFEVPYKNIECFSYWDDLFFFIEQNQVVSIDIQGNKKIWYQSDKGSFLQQNILIK